MPTIDQLVDWAKAEQAKGKGHMHTQHPVIMEEVRKEAIKNTAEKTRVGFETYSPACYRSWNARLEALMEECGKNPILVMDVILVLLQDGWPENVRIVKESLFKVSDYEKELREARIAKKKRKASKNDSD